MTAAIAPMVGAYIVLAVLLVSLNIASRWWWPIKAGAIVVTTGFFAASYFGAVSLLGWPSRSPLPPRFQLLWTKIVEPDRHSGTPGGIFLWVDPLDENNVPLGKPRAYEMRWDPDLAKKVAGAQEKRQAGEDVAGKVENGEEQTEEKAQAKMLQPPTNDAQAVNGVDTVPFRNDSEQVQFEDMPAPTLPEKPRL